MKPRHLYIAAVLILLVPVYFQFFYQKSAEAISGESKSLKTWETKIDETPPVVVSVTPLELGKDGPAWKFGLSLETHSGDLGYDLLKSVVLEDGEGRSIFPSRWEGPSPGGHHLDGELIFEPIPSAKRITIKVLDVGGVSERSFEWEVN